MHLVEDILKTFKRNRLSNFASLSVKIRLLKCNKKSIALCRMIERCNVDAIAIHARYQEDRSEKVSARTDLVKNIVDVVHATPIIYNGDIFQYEDIEKYKKLTNCQNMMISRGAIFNPSIFCEKGFKNINDIVAEYMSLNEKYNFLSPFHKSKFVMESMILKQQCFKKSSSIFKEFHQCRSYQESRLVNKKLKQFGLRQSKFESRSK